MSYYTNHPSFILGYSYILRLKHNNIQHYVFFYFLFYQYYLTLFILIFKFVYTDAPLQTILVVNKPFTENPLCSDKPS